jgi:DNA-directed RNA polymerase specialized sigma24 family protein
MLLYDNTQSDTIPAPKWAHYHKSVWGDVYDKYAPIMYGTILKMTGDTAMSEDILEEVFVDLYRKKMLSPEHTAPCLSLLRHTFKLTLTHLEEHGLKTKEQFNEHYPLINLFYFKHATVKDVANKFEKSDREVLEKLKEEFNHFCNQRT